ncbi:MAG: M48 family metalloprotease [Patescibacteria group bacterium]|nr:M48 family metalloprotease [Patescibacteria group bacterium]
MYNQIESNKRKSWVLMALFVGLLALVGYVYGYVTDTGYFGLVFALGISTIWTLFSWFGGSSMTLWSCGASELTDKSQFPTLWNVVENLSITAGVPMPKVYIVNDPSPNAFATGRDPKHASVAVTTGLLKLLDKTELEGVLSHELSHVKNFDTRLMILAAVLVGAIVMLGNWMFHGSLFGRRGRDRDSGNILMILGILFILLAPLVGQLIQLAISRKREYLADASGALLTRYPEGLASALEKIRNSAIPMQQTSNATNHLWISDPTAKSLGERVGGLFSTHPPINDRIKLLREMLEKV